MTASDDASPAERYRRACATRDRLRAVPAPRKTQRRDLAGERYGRLRVLQPVRERRGEALWACRCDCGAVTTVRTSSLTSGNTRSCGCGAPRFSRHPY